MSPEPSFTQALREEGFIQGSDVVSETNETKVENTIKEEAQKVEDTVIDEVETKVNQAKSFVDEQAESTSSDSFIGKLVDTIKNIF